VTTFRKFFRLLSPPDVKPEPDYVIVNTQRMPVVYRRHARAKNYVMRLQTNRTVVITMPKRGSLKFAQEFVASRKAWLEKQWKVLEERNIPPLSLHPGMEILLRGQPTLLQVVMKKERWELHFGTERLPIPSPEMDFRPMLESHLHEVARKELRLHAEELAQRHNSTIRKVVVRNQKSRWGSCSYNGTISLNWRLIQVPEHVRDYIIIHELMHLRELNHSPRFWAQVAQACPDYQNAEAWLKENSGRVGF
jgi:predicted metal-dependent hydrolase